MRTIPDLTVVVPTFNERANIRPLVGLLDAALAGIAWEVVFVDDDSPDGTADEVRAIGRDDGRVRVLQRIGRRGLAGATIEGILSSIAPIVAVMDADMQHDETRLATMFAMLRDDPGLDIVIASRNAEGGSAAGGFSGLRRWMSESATGLARRLLKVTATDPMSGFFMLRRARFNEVVTQLQPEGFKVLLDILSSSRGQWRVAEVPYSFRARRHGESKLDSAVALEFLALLVARATGGVVSIRFVLFALVGLSGVAVQLAAVRLMLWLATETFLIAQTAGVIVAMTTNFVLNNLLTYRDRALKGRAFLKGLLSFYAVCSIGAVANVGVGEAVYAVLPQPEIASATGAVVGALWNFLASSAVTWRAR
jgi:dolichol-phosphate mannosyltransferase